ncbi:F0F1 ATP synthase assembly protein I [Rhodopseudomonas boonkerdii]|uniref:AtpZ/AtpI family protein n=1 Tax=Rhodopseudomonas boonkerdii TaxID=475937 RepID=UPI001E2D257B|nr:AtpZ/AtpI family protein [Rhodopseudomonas boonkerdii]UGV24820.1 F0F1 ATP synthase assembly protein I [Rhodopseudomonas boonkerdii]
MSDGTKKDSSNQGTGSLPDLDEAALSARLGSLNERLSKTLGDRKLQADQSDSGSGNAQARASAMAVGLRLSSELVAGVVVGTILGWVFDRLLSTSPWGLIVFMLLGFVAGVMNVMRSAGVGKKS